MSSLNDERFFLQADRELGLRGSFVDWVPMAWPIVEPGTEFHSNWHIDCICEHLEAVSRGQIRNLLMNVPPGCSKSLLVSVFWPTWDWMRVRPEDRFINVSYDGKLTLRDANRQLMILQSQWFQERWGDKVSVPASVAGSDFSNLQGGWRFSTSVKGKMTGRHCDIMLIDDPHKPQDISKVSLEAVKRWWHETVPTRFGDQKTGRRVVIMQRLHQEDLSGHIIEQGGFEHLRLPMRFEAKACSYTKIGGDPRTEDGELLDPVRFPAEEVERIETRELGARGTASQFQQRPSPAAGAVFRREWFKFYMALPARFDQIIQSWDCAFKDTDGSDYVCGGVWGIVDAQFYLIHRVWEHLDFPSTCDAVESVTRKFPKATLKLIEDKANGTAVIQTLRKKIAGIVEVTPQGGKEARAHAVTPLFEAGNVFIPDSSLAPWVDQYVEELATFPFAAHDDQVDMTTQALVYLMDKAANYKQAMANAKKIFGFT